MRREYSLAWIISVLLLAAALRIVGTGSTPVWTDEGWSIWASSDPAQVIGLVATDRHPPLYFTALSVWRQAAGDTPLALRFLSVAAGLLLVAVVYRIGADWFGRQAGILAALLLAALPAAVYYAQEVRHYGWLTLFSALSWLVLLRYLKRPTRGLWIGYVLSVTAMLYTLYFGVFTLAAQGVTAALLVFGQFLKGDRPYKRIVRWASAIVGAWLAAGMLYLPWVSVIVTQQAGILGSGITGAPGTLAAANVLPVLQVVFGEQMAIPLAAFALGTWAILRQRTVQRLGVLIGGGGLLTAMIALSTRFDFLAARTLIFLTPLLMVVCGYGLNRLGAALAGSRAGSRAFLRENISLVAAAVWVALTLALPQTIQPRLDSGAAARALAAYAQPGDAIILETGWDDNAFAYEIEQALAQTIGASRAEIVRTLPWTNDRTGGAPVVPEIEPVLQAHSRVWVVQWLQAVQVLPFLESGGDGFVEAGQYDVSAGEYGARFSAPTIVVRLFEREDR